jgi:hypothetical protein
VTKEHDPHDLALLDLVDSDEICMTCGHLAEEHDDDLPARCLAHGDVHPCDCEAFVPEIDDLAEEDAA